MIKSILFTLMLMGMTGCQSGGIGMAESPAWFATATVEQQAAYFRKRCSAYGFKPDTPDMAKCIQSEANSSRAGARLQTAVASQAMANSTPRSVTSNCSRFGNSVTCNSY